MGVDASFRSATEQELDRARRDAAYAARLLNEPVAGDETPGGSSLSVQRRTFYIQRFSLDTWEHLVADAPVNVFKGEDYVDLDWDYNEDAEEDDDGPSQAMEIDPGLIEELAGWLRDAEPEDIYDGMDEDEREFVEAEFEDFRTFVLAVAERGEGALLHVA
ncbi:hypothetical protein [Saccharopolyspora elongata]|uniref:DUF1877 family protein n=1 Tax=Saccharopolyspora elongata TaxID=2530387 RepID=A0A4R4Z194_9PSEU|nr:hypothetical protein [Saccharopolyspora elongata]TDD51655.1 hypothetical protein E1288_13860 [Saccharopolyspora elongata]